MMLFTASANAMANTRPGRRSGSDRSDVVPARVLRKLTIEHGSFECLENDDTVRHESKY